MNTAARAALRIPTIATIVPVPGTTDTPKVRQVVSDMLPATVVFHRDGFPMTTSKIVAKLFSKDHKSVMKEIRNLLKRSPDLAPCFVVEMIDAKAGCGGVRKVPSYVINARSAILLTMGSRGPSAMCRQKHLLDGLGL